MLPARAGDQLFHKALRGEREQVVDALAHADEPDGQAQPLLDGYHAAALGGAVQLGQDLSLIHIYTGPVDASELNLVTDSWPHGTASTSANVQFVGQLDKESDDAILSGDTDVAGATTTDGQPANS